MFASQVLKLSQKQIYYVITILNLITLIIFTSIIDAVTDSKSHLVKETTVIMIENDGNMPINYHLIDCDERNGPSRLSHIVAKLTDELMPVDKTDDGKYWRIDLSSKPIEPGVKVPLQVTKVYTHLELVPDHDVYLMPYSSIHYQVRIVKQGRPQKIKIPSERYYLVIDNRDIVDLDEASSTAYALDSEGTTKIRFVDKSVIADEDFIQPESIIHIVQPNYLTMHITPGESWDLKKFTDYTIEIRIFDAQQHQIYPSENLNIQLVSGNELVITNSTANGTYHTIHTLNSGPSKLVAHLLGTHGSLFDRSQALDIEYVQELQIHEPLEIRPTAIVLPWLPESKPSYQVSIFAAGGTGSYMWSTNNSALTEIKYSGDDSSIAKVTTKGEGTAFVQCTDTKSTVFLRHAMIVVSRIVELSVLPSIIETELGGDILLPVAVYANRSILTSGYFPEDDTDSDLVLFHDCSKIKFDVEIVEKTRFSHDSSEVVPNDRPKSCASLKFTCTQAGSSRVWVSYTDPTDPSLETIKTTTIIACYKPLRPVYPKDVGVLALQTSIEMAFEGGPRPFGNRIDDHFSHLEPNSNSIVSFEPVIDRYRFNKDLHVFKVYCNQYGEVELALSVGNQPSVTLPNPASSKTSLKIVCAKPDSLQLKPRLKDSCPLNDMASLLETLVPISSTSPIDFELFVFDESRRQFLNISSLSISWTLSGHGFIKTKQIEEVNAVAGFRRVTRNYVTVQPSAREGLGKIQANLHSYKHQSPYRDQTLDLTSSLDIQFVEHARIQPNRTIVYNHRRNIVVLSISNGSGYFSVEVESMGAKHANVTYVSVLGHHRINITPLSAGKFILRLEDQCLESNHGLPMLSEVSIMNEIDFNREALKPGNTLKYCRDVDENMFCVYLSVDKIATAQPTTRPPISNIPHSTLRAKVDQSAERLKFDSVQRQQVPQQTTSKPAQIERVKEAARTTTTTTTTTASPRVVFDNSHSSSKELEVVQKSSFLQRFFAYLMVFAVTSAAITLGYKWWQDQVSRRPQGAAQNSSAETSFLRHTPSKVDRSGSTRFSPSSSKGPSSSTPRARPLYTERFSTTLLSD